MLYHVDQFPFDKLNLEILPKGRKRPKKLFVDAICAFDIETTNIDSIRNSIMYIWQFQINDDTIYGRTWEDFQYFKNRLEQHVPDDSYLVIWVHNLSFEFQFIKSIIHIDEVFAMDDRKVLRVRSGRFEFRCSYLHSNMSLEKYLQQMHVPDQKVKGFDYSKKRYPWTELTDDELLYCINDVRGLVQAIRFEMEKDGDNLYTVPLTSTGYSRRLAKKVLGGYRPYIIRMLPDLEIFNGLRMAFRGGDTHSNRFNTGIIIRNVSSADISSSYPAVMLSERFPGKFYKQDPKYFNILYKHGKALLIHLYMENVRLADPRFGDPYIPKAKCIHLSDPVIDNGRVLEAHHLDMWMTEIDFEIIAKEYEFEYQILDLFSATKSKLPKVFRDLLLQTYADKTMLKGKDEYLYGKKKALFNSYYGMMVQNPCKPNYEFNNGILQEKEDETMFDLIENYQKHGWLPYQWGVWVTAYARKKLHEGLWMIDPDDFVYCDTDSIKYTGDYTEEFKKLNEKYKDEDLSALDPDGKRHYIGIFEYEETYKRFKTLGAKKYAYDSQDDKLHITIAGVNKKLGAKELGSIENFEEGFIFNDAGGMDSLYNDDPEVKEMVIDGHKLRVTSNIALYPSSYTLGLSPDYGELIRFLMNSDIRYSLHYER